MQELTGFGYLRRVQHHKPNGDFGEVECGVIASPAYFARQGLPPCGACTAAGKLPLCETRTARALQALCGFAIA